MKISDQTSVAMPMRNLISIVMAVAVGVWAYFGVIERINKLETSKQLMSSDLEKNTEFRIKWPRGEMGSLPADSEQFMLIEDLYKTVEKLQSTQEMNMTNKVNIEFLQKQVEKLLDDVEKLKDANREIKYTNGNGH
jgi:Zn-dependent M32 family carboxypeptidase